MFRKNMVIFGSIIACILLIIYSKDAMSAALNAFQLWLNKLFPALFPFFVCSSVLQKAGLLNLSSKTLDKISKALRLPSSALPVALLSCVSGAPSGARMCGMLVDDGRMTGDDANLIAPICNMASPMFIAGSLSIGMLGSPKLAYPVLMAQYTSMFLLLSVCGRFKKRNAKAQSALPISLNSTNLKNILPSAIYESILAILTILGTITFFLVMMRLLSSIQAIKHILLQGINLLGKVGISKSICAPFFTGVLEMTAGCQAIEPAALNVRQVAGLCAFITSFSGGCVYIQSLSFVSLNPKKYFGIKGLHGILAGIIAYIMAPLFICGDTLVFAEQIDKAGFLSNAASGAAILASSLLSVAVIFLISAGISKRTQ